MKIEGGKGFLGSTGCREDGKHWFLWLRLQEPSREAAAAYWSHWTLKMLHQPLVCSKMHFPRRCFMSKGGRTQMPVWIMIWNRDRLLICYFMKGWLHWQDKWDWVPLAAEMRAECCVMDGLDRKYTKDTLRSGEFNVPKTKNQVYSCGHTHTYKHTHRHTVPIFKGQSVWLAHWTNGYSQMHACMHLETYSYSLFICLRMIVFHNNIPFIICFPLVYSNRM